MVNQIPNDPKLYFRFKYKYKTKKKTNVKNNLFWVLYF